MEHKLKTKSTGVCHLLRLALELRDPIYRMLLTTPYCTNLSPKGHSLKFHLYPSILLVNKQISAEATRVLYQENDFVVFRATGIGLLLSWVPKFNLLSETRIPRPVLRIEIAIVDGTRVGAGNLQTFVTTAEGLRSIISAIWILENYNRHFSNVNVEHADLCLTLDFHVKAKARYEVLSTLLLAPWTMVNGFKELVLTGDIKEPIRNRLQISNDEGPFLSQVTSHILEYQLLAELAFINRNESAARWWYATLEQYWVYIYNFRTRRLGGHTMWVIDFAFHDLLMKMAPMYFEGRLKLVKTCLRQLRYKDAASYANEVLRATRLGGGWATDLGYTILPEMWKKFELAILFAQDSSTQLRINPETL
jgi:hypothetical protein